ncbi:hypothetical protein O1611_g1503 [Lasiodiplodia mahajangana]|uniref:Uncharacterized protein n=1 Tax=Lasiodiplodia mahajangana TaxID=1108764 RepID=A0ACC2JXH2_9PEZI|nr:hypothetical protein O1611_g1503 [Lasiodiplodia mahajangana]
MSTAYSSSYKDGNRYLADVYPDSESNEFESEYDLAYTHKRNQEVRRNQNVISCLSHLKNVESLKDVGARDWLLDLPHRYRSEIIPLFETTSESEQKSGDDDEDYQLYPNYSWLRSGKYAAIPHPALCRLSGPKNVERQIPRYITSLGRLFVNARNGNRFNTPCDSKRQRLTRWTGYELFISDDLGIWSVFDSKSTISDARPWYPVSSRLGEKQRSGMACLLPSVKKLGDATFEEIVACVENTRVEGVFQIDEVEESEVKEWLDGKLEETIEHTLRPGPRTTIEEGHHSVEHTSPQGTPFET